MLNKTLSVLILILALLAFTGCSDDDGDNNGGDTSSGDTNASSSGSDTNASSSGSDTNASSSGSDTNASSSGMDTAPMDTAPMDTAPMDTAPMDTAPMDTAPMDTSDAGDAGDVSDVSDTGDTTASGCDITGFTAFTADAFYFQGFGYIAQSTDATPVDTLNFELIPPDGASGVGTYTITADGYETCSNCLLIYQGCDETLSMCDRTFLAQSGVLDIASPADLSNASGQQFQGTLTDATFIEVTLSGSTSTPVVDGEVWCIDSYSFDRMIQ